MSILNNPAERAKFVFGMPMQPCPKCGSYNMKYQLPIKMLEDISAGDTANQILGKWARTELAGDPELEGPAYLMCFDCFHEGPKMDCKGMTSGEAMRNKLVADTVKKLWNDQPRRAK